MREIAWISNKGEVIYYPYTQRKSRIDMWAAEIVEQYYPESANDYDYADEFLMRIGWAEVVKLDLVDYGIYVRFRQINDKTYNTINDFLHTNYMLNEWSTKLKTDWAYESTFH